MRRWIPNIAVAAYDVDALNYFGRVEAAEGVSSTFTAQKATINSWFLEAKGLGPYSAVNFFSDIQRLNFFGGATLTGATVPAIKTLGSTLDAFTSFVSGDFSPTSGLTGDSTTKSLDTGLVANTLTANSTHQGFFNLSGAGNTGSHGAFDGALNRMLMQPPWILASLFDDEYNSSTGRIFVDGTGTPVVLPPYGHLLGTRRGAADQEVYQNGVSLGTGTGAAGTLPNYSLFVFAMNNAGSADHWRADQLGAYHYGKGLSAAKALAISSSLTRLMTGLGRLSNTDDFFLHLQGATAGNTLTQTILANAANHAGAWAGVINTDPATYSAMTVRANATSRASDVIVNGVTFPAGNSDLCFDYNHSTANQTFNAKVSIVSPLIVIKCKVLLGPTTTSFNLFDFIGAQFVDGTYGMQQLTTNTGQYAFNIETDPNGPPTLHTTDVTVTPGTWIGLCIRLNTVVGLAEMTVYDASNNIILPQVSGPITTGTNISLVTVGNNEAGVDAGKISKFQGLRWSLTNPTYPVIP